MNRLILPVLLVVLLTQVLLAQKVPGYLGKKYSLEYDAFLFPSFLNPNSPHAETNAESDLIQKGVSLNLQHHLIGQWSLSKKASIIGNVGYVNTNYLPKRFSDYYGTFRFKFPEYPSMHVINPTAGIRIFKQHYAPLGKFVEFRIGFATVITEDFTYTVLLKNQAGVKQQHVFTVDGGKMTWPTIAMAFGSSRVLKDFIIVSYGLDFNFFPGGAGHYINGIYDGYGGEFREQEEGNTSKNQTELVKMAGARYAMHSGMNWRLGIGILL